MPVKTAKRKFIMSEKKKEVKRIFESIAPRYDLLNHILSAGVDYYWRKKALKLTGMNKDSVLLDVACGTGDFAIEARKLGVEKIFGGDFSYNMLSLFNRKSAWIRGMNFQMAAENPPLKNGSVTNITVAFGVRNFYDIETALQKFYYLLKDNGKVTILEFSLPENVIFKAIYQFYFRRILPFVGKVISKDPTAYTYLPESVNEFDKKVDLVRILKNAGFRKVGRTLLTFGIVQVVIAEK